MSDDQGKCKGASEKSAPGCRRKAQLLQQLISELSRSWGQQRKGHMNIQISPAGHLWDGGAARWVEASCGWKAFLEMCLSVWQPSVRPAHAHKHTLVTYLARVDQRPHKACHPCSCGAGDALGTWVGWEPACWALTSMGGSSPAASKFSLPATLLRRGLGVSLGHVTFPLALLVTP